MAAYAADFFKLAWVITSHTNAVTAKASISQKRARKGQNYTVTNYATFPSSRY
jgi:hypothetical protein